jgi:hypothetical protein
MINVLYNVCDVGMNTCIGEGFGLCNMEHAVLGKPQVVSKVGALRDIFGDEAIEPAAWYQIPNIEDEHTGIGGFVSHKDVADKLDDIYQNYTTKYKPLYDEKISKDFYEKYHWPTILSQLTALVVTPKNNS